MSINYVLLKEILEYCDNKLPSPDQTQFTLSSFPNEDFPSLNPFDRTVFKYHVDLLVNKGCILESASGVYEGITELGEKKLIELKQPKASDWIKALEKDS